MRSPEANKLDRVNRAHSNRRVFSHLLVVCFAVLLLESAGSAQTNLYQLRGDSDYGIYVYNIPTNTTSTVYQPYPVLPAGSNSATIAQRPSDGMLFYAMYLPSAGNNPRLFRFNPATPNVAPVPVGTGLGATVPSSLRMAFSPSGTLYYLPDTRVLYTINTATGVATSTGVTIGNSSTITSGGDMAFSPAGTLYISTSSKTLWTANITSGAVTQVGNAPVSFSPSANATIGLAFNAAGELLAQTQNPNNIYRIPLPVGSTSTPTGVLVTGGDGDTGSTGDMASANVPQPNLTITKTDGVTTVYRGGPITYTIVVTNSGTYTITGTVTDTVPAAIIGETWTCVASPGSSCAAASGSGNINTSATLEAGDTATYTITGTISASASGTLSNTATVALPAWLIDSTPANNTATDNDTINLNANLGITKTDGLANINPGSAVTYTIVVSNAGPDTSNGSIVTDTVPAAITGVTWTCGSPTGGATCGAASGSGNSISTTANLPSGGSVTYTISGTLAATATGTLSNTATVLTAASGVTDPNDPSRTGAANNSATDTTTINSVPDVRIAKSHSGNFTVGVNGSYTLTASNAGTAATSGTITVTDNLPTGLTVAAVPAPVGWNCSTTVVGSTTMTCTSSTVIPAGANHPNPITLTVVVAPAAFPSVTNAATISGGGEPASMNGNNSASDPTTVNGVSDVRITKSHSGNFTVGVNGSYTLTTSNAGTLATSGTITVTDNLPSGLTVAAVPAPAGWNCSTTVVGSSTMTCTSSTVIPAGANHPNPITLTVVVAPAAFPSVTNAATISGGGEPAYNNGNNSASDPTIVNGIPDLTVAKSHTGNFTQGQAGATYSITVTNSGTAATSGTVTLVDTLPSGLTATGMSGTGWTCGLGTLTCTRNDALAPGASYAFITLTVDVSLTAPTSVTNTATVSGGGENNASNNTANDPTTIDVAAAPSISLVKSVSPVGPQIPGADLAYTIGYTNTGGQPANNFVIVDPNMANPVPPERVFRNVDFKIGSMTSSPGSTGLVATFEYSNDGGTSWTYTPVNGGGGAPAGYDRLVTNIRWAFTGNLSHTAPNNAGSVGFTSRIR